MSSFLEEECDEPKTELDASDQWLKKYPHILENKKFAPRDLLALLKNLDTEISQYESMLIDEIEKRKKYKVVCILKTDHKKYIMVSKVLLQLLFFTDWRKSENSWL